MDEVLKVLNTFTYLKKINLAYNKIRDIPIIPKNIEMLIMNNNALAGINENILNASKLTTLDLSNNNITNIAILKNISNLKFLFLKNNKVG